MSRRFTSFENTAAVIPFTDAVNPFDADAEVEQSVEIPSSPIMEYDDHAVTVELAREINDGLEQISLYSKLRSQLREISTERRQLAPAEAILLRALPRQKVLATSIAAARTVASIESYKGSSVTVSVEGIGEKIVAALRWVRFFT